MKQNEKSENRKALPKYIAILLAAALIGGLVGGFSVVVGHTGLPAAATAAIHQILTQFTPFSFYILTGILGAIELLLYRQAQQLFEAWDGEEETVMERSEEKLSWVLLLTSLNLVLDFFFFGLLHLLDDSAPSLTLLTLAGFTLSIAFIVVMQQKTVDLIKKMNPEKRGSVYDMKFHKTWLASCDENEQRQIGQAAYQSFMATTYTCVGLFLVLFLLGMIYPVGILPIFLVMLIWGVSQVTFCLASIRLGRRKS